MLATRPVVVWGNCQAAPLADLLRTPLARHGWSVEVTPAVHLITADELERVHASVARCAVLVTQPVSDDYHLPGCGSAALMAEAPPGARVVTLPVAFHVGPFPYQVHAHGGDGARVNAPVTDYHDLRAIAAAAQGFDVDAALRWWPTPHAAAVHAVREMSLRQLADRESMLDVQIRSLLDAPDAMWTMSHPTNRVLGEMARRILIHLGFEADVRVPEREYLGERRAPIEAAVAAGYGWSPAEIRAEWTVRETVVPQRELLTAHLDFYRARPDVVADSLIRHARRMSVLGLDR